jgi:hypothetical protein
MTAELELIYEKDDMSVYCLLIPGHNGNLPVVINVDGAEARELRSNMDDVAFKKALDIMEELQLEEEYKVKVVR